MSAPTAFTIKYNTIVNQLIFPCVIAHNGIVLRTKALIDTGAMSNYISTDLFMSLKLLRTGQEVRVSTTKFDGIYPFVKAEYLGVTKSSIFHDCTFIAMPFVDKDFGIILGMDFLQRGDLIVSHLNHRTTVTVRRPSQSTAECQNVVDENDIPQLIKIMRTLPIDTIHIDS